MILLVGCSCNDVLDLRKVYRRFISQIRWLRHIWSCLVADSACREEEKSDEGSSSNLENSQTQFLLKAIKFSDVPEDSDESQHQD